MVGALWALVRTSLLTSMQYRADFLFDGLTGLVRSFATAAPLWLVYTHTDAVLGWGVHDAALVMSLYLLLQAIVGGLVEPNLGVVVEAVRNGSLDLVLMKPVDAQWLVSLRAVAPARMWDLIASLGLGTWALSHLPTPAPLDVFVACCMLGCGLVSMYSLWLLTICSSFFFVRVGNLRFLLDSVNGAGRWPITVFSDSVRWVLTVLIPVGIVTSFPALALRGDWDIELVAVAAGTALVFGVGSRLAWRYSLAAYTSASS